MQFGFFYAVDIVRLLQFVARAVETLHATSLPECWIKNAVFVETLHATSQGIARKNVAFVETLHATSLHCGDYRKNVAFVETLHATSLHCGEFRKNVVFVETLHATSLQGDGEYNNLFLA